MNPALSELESGAAALGLRVSPEALVAFDHYLDELLAWRSRLNLTAASSPQDLVRLHFLDSLLVLAAAALPVACRVADVGSGAGFPGLPLKITRPDLRVTLIEASRRRVAFLEHVREALDLSDLAVVWARAEELAHRPAHREAFQAVVTRAAAAIGASAELCLPLVEVGGVAVLLRGPRASGEARAVWGLVEALGGTIEVCQVIVLPGTDRKRAALVVRKTRPSPLAFPRQGRSLGRFI